MSKNLKPFEEARRLVQEQARLLGSEQVELSAAVGRILARDVCADLDMPPFDRSAMDGYACRQEDLGGSLVVRETIPAGKAPTCKIEPGTCAKIMTGGMVPDGADCVIMVEYSETVGEDTIRFNGEKTRTDIRRRGEDRRAGDILLRPGQRLRPQEVALLAGVGCTRPHVATRPRVAIVTTGDELVEPDQTPEPWQIRNTNATQLCAQVTGAGSVPYYQGIAPDDKSGLDRCIGTASRDSDVLLVCGGVSMGDFDFVPGVLAANGYRFLFEKIALKPGKPTIFGVSDSGFCFGLPGNPVSTFVVFELLVKPFLYALMGHTFEPPVVTLRLEEAVKRRKAQRESWIPVKTTSDGGVRPLGYHGSGDHAALTCADGLIRIPRESYEVPEGTLVDVRQI